MKKRKPESNNEKIGFIIKEYSKLNRLRKKAGMLNEVSFEQYLFERKEYFSQPEGRGFPLIQGILQDYEQMLEYCRLTQLLIDELQKGEDDEAKK